MGSLVITGATLMCAFGTAPANFMATSNPTVMCGGKPTGTIEDATAMKNIPSFGLCTTLSNPQVAAATAAALGVLTPQACIPQTTAWIPAGKALLSGGKPCLTSDCTCMCAYGGTITVKSPGQMTVRTAD